MVLNWGTLIRLSPLLGQANCMAARGNNNAKDHVNVMAHEFSTMDRGHLEESLNALEWSSVVASQLPTVISAS